MSKLIALTFSIVVILALVTGWLYFGDHIKTQLNNWQKDVAESNTSAPDEPSQTVFIPPKFDSIKPIDSYYYKIPNEGVFILADLAKETVTTYQNGSQVNQAEILSKGASGSFWETPTGLYEIQYRNENHVSSIGNVNMPYSMQYSGNFFIHGWPTYLDGSDVGPGYSGGCIRLNTPGAASIFPYTAWGTKLLVVDSETLNANYSADLDQTDYEALDNLSAKGVIIANSNNGQVYFAKNSEREFNLGSIANFLVAFAANENISYASEIPEYIKSNGAWQKDGNKYVLAIRYPTLLSEDGDTDVVSLVRYHGSKVFMDYLDTKTNAIGMAKTNHTLNSDDTINSIARLEDWYHLARYLYHQKPFMIENSGDIVINEPYISYVTNLGQTDSAINFIEVSTSDNRESIIVILTESTDLNADFGVVKDIFQ